ncbi:MAG: hypothetical protein UU13_C0018G0004 [Candidatus Nomurabacteria bacterium GW2011_GWB1_40_7]|uniref:DUF5671 domain-containing protein n=1 Tax=Candidatus Nomurabacteria bacterium GW2011_GWB1_40_7 TaxID=1618744 RepID=A0A0G0W3T0_9BACT|nr:MAG: hypothetical protein UU13_C0018G0004 [Candidatus Nomurabacteria bacterium GW2011_GWB1_40_7]
METQESQTQSKTTAKDFFINLGAIVTLGFFVGNLISLLFTIINKVYPLTTGYNYYGSSSISFPVAALIIGFPGYILLMWLLEKGYFVEPEKRQLGIRKWLTYITLFLAGLAIAGDLVTLLYYFIDGQELTTGFIMKVLSVLVIALAIFFYYISDVRNKLNSVSRKVWVAISSVVMLSSIIWGFSVLGSPRTQQLLKYDEQKASDLQNIENSVQSFYSLKGILPNDFTELEAQNYYLNTIDSQTKKSYEYQKTSDTTYNLCAEFNKELTNKGYPTRSVIYEGFTWTHPAGYHCFSKTINPNSYFKPAPAYQ